MWTRASAIAFVEEVEEVFAAIGLQLTVVGSVANQGQSVKDLDVLVQPIAGVPKALELTLDAVFSAFVPAYTVDTNTTLNPLPTNEPEEQTFVNFGLKDGRTLELFFPERLFPTN